MKKKGIVGVMNNPATSMNSHSAGWNMIIRDMLGPTAKFLTEADDWNEYNELYINHGPNFKPGVFNIIGGIGDDVHTRLSKLWNFEGPIYSVDGFDPEEFIAKRKIDHISVGSKIPWNIRPWAKPSFDKLVWGDSHSISVWQPGYSIIRLDGKTLYGFLKTGHVTDKFKDMILYFGNIDVRFHLPRQPKIYTATKELAKRYIEFAKASNATIVNLLPVESESRKLPKSGWYKGKSFFGSHGTRTQIVELFNHIINTKYDKVIKWPEEWYDSPEYFEREVMEPKQSVHIRPKFYTRFYGKDTLF